MGSGSTITSDRDHLQHQEPQGTVPAVPLSGNRVRHDRPCSDPLPARQGHRPEEKATCGRAPAAMEQNTPCNDLRTLRNGRQGQPVGIPPAPADSTVSEGAEDGEMTNLLWMLVPWAVFAVAAGFKFWRLTSAWRQRGAGRTASTDQFRRSLERIWAQTS